MKKRFIAIVPILNQHDVTKKVMSSWFDLSKNKLDVIFIDNGSDKLLSEQPFIKEWSKFHNIQVIRNDENIGVYPTFQQGFDIVDGLEDDYDFIFYSHNDVEMLEYSWDQKMASILQHLLESGIDPGICGMFGADGIGLPNIYVDEYDFMQMMRLGCITVDGMRDVNSNRGLYSDYERVIILDGFSLIVNTSMIKEVLRSQFDHKRFPAHHMYDIDMCVESHLGGYNNFIININCLHHGGVTSTREKWAEKMGTTDLEMHRKAHKVFYEKWRGKLPLHLDESKRGTIY